jgi:hypothetical protein
MTFDPVTMPGLRLSCISISCCDLFCLLECLRVSVWVWLWTGGWVVGMHNKVINQYSLWSRLNPYAEFAYDGTALNPFEVLFIKIKAFTLDRGWASPTLAVKYAHWIDAEVWTSYSP